MELMNQKAIASTPNLFIRSQYC